MKCYVPLTDTDTGPKMPVDEEVPKVFGQIVLQEGYMFKQSCSVWKHQRQWRARYFALTEENLYCYKNKYDFRNFPMEAIQLKGMTMTLEEYAEKNCTRFCMKLCSQSAYTKRAHYLSCYSEEERNVWMTAILQALATKWIEKTETKNLSELSNGHRVISRSLDSLPLHGTLTITKPERRKSSIGERLLSGTNVFSLSAAPMRHPSSKLGVRKAKALSLVENINIRNDFVLQYE